MPLPEGCKLRKGDIVIFHAVVNYDNEAEGENADYRISLTPIGRHSSFHVAIKDIEGIFCKSFQVDDRVQIIRREAFEGVPLTTGTVLNTYRDDVWMTIDGEEKTQVVKANSLELVEPK